MSNSNLVQIEFFHVKRSKTPTLEELLAECSEVLIDSMLAKQAGIESRSRIKTVLRLYDTDNVLTLLALHSKELELQTSKVQREFPTAGWFRKKSLNRTSRQLAGKSLELKKQCLTLAVAELRKNIVAKNVIAIEKSDHTFRLVQRNELHEIFESAKGSYGVCLFVFEPNDLLSQVNKAVAHAM